MFCVRLRPQVNKIQPETGNHHGRSCQVLGLVWIGGDLMGGVNFEVLRTQVILDTASKLQTHHIVKRYVNVVGVLA